MEKVAIVTGANHGIGEATAVELARNGYNVIVTWLDPNDYAYSKLQDVEMQHTMGGKHEADRVVDDIIKGGGKAEAIPLDLSRTESIPEVFDLAEKVFGPVEALVNNAAHGENKDALETMDEGVFERTYAVNVRAPLLLIQEFVRRYRLYGLRKGAVVNISTDAAQYFAGQINYGASKASMEASTRSLAVELGKYGIRVNGIAPGPVHTGTPVSYITPEMEEQLNKKIPLGRCGQPIDIARALCFFVSDDAGWITGQVLRVDGGHSWGRCVL